MAKKVAGQLKLQVPAGKQDIWNDIRVTFDPREMLGL